MPKKLCLAFQLDNLVTNFPGIGCHTEAGATGPSGFIEGDFIDSFGLAMKTKGNCPKKFYIAAPDVNRIFVFDACGATAQNTILATSAAGVTGGADGNPQAVIVNTCCDGFVIEHEGVTGPAQIIVGNQGASGGISGFNPDVNALFTVPVVPPASTPFALSNYTAGVIFKKHLYMVNSGLDQIEKYDKNWALVETFKQDSLDYAGYRPYGIGVVKMCGKKRLLVTFSNGARQGDGYVEVLREDGTFYNLINREPLNLPYAVFSLCIDGVEYLAVGNRGDGRINFFDMCGTWLSSAEDKYGNILAVSNLTGMAPDPEKGILYYTGSSRGRTAFFGRLTCV